MCTYPWWGAFFFLPCCAHVGSQTYICHVWLFVTPMDCSSPGSSVQGIFLGKNTEVGCHSLLLGIFVTQGLNPGLPHYRRILYYLSHQRSPRILEGVAIPFSRGSSRPRDQTHVSCVSSIGRILYHWATWESPLVSQPGIKPMSPALKMQSQLLDHQGSPMESNWIKINILTLFQNINKSVSSSSFWHQ